MIRRTNPLDFARIALLREPGKTNRAHTLRNLRSEKSFGVSLIQVSKASLAARGESCAWVCHMNSRVVGLAAARQRSGPQCWEITHLFLTPEGESDFPELLENVAQSAASSGAQKVFIRLRQDDPLVDMGRLSGFFPCIPEVLYKGLPTRKDGKHAPSSDDFPQSLRRKVPSDEHDLFRLYNAAVPSEIRRVIGMTFEQWNASHERYGGRCEEFVITNEDKLRGWLTSVQQSANGQIGAMIHPDEERYLASVVEFGIEHLAETKAVYCLVPEYQFALLRALEDRGFEAVSDYITLVKSMAVTAQEKTRAGATAASA